MGPRGISQVVFQHPEVAGFITNEVNSRHVNANAVGRCDAPRLTMEVSRCRDQAARNDSVRENLTGPVDIREKGLQRLDSLNDARFDGGPLGCGQNARDQIHGERPLPLAESKGDAVAVEVGITKPCPLVEFLSAESGQHPV